MSVVRNAVVTHAYVGLGGYDDKILSLYVRVDVQDEGSMLVEGWDVGIPPMNARAYVSDTPLGEVILCWLNTTGAKSVDDMVGKPIRLRMACPWGGADDVEAVGHFVRDDWFSTKDICNSWKARTEAAK
jgi:hypothetical protein